MNPGDRYGRYEIARMLGRGAMGEVYLARDTEQGRYLALKLVYKGPDPEDQEIVDAERLGAELQKRLSGFDRRVVVVNRYGEINGDLFIDMEYIEGEDLSTILNRGPLAPGFATHIGVELCEMLENLGAFRTTIGDHEFVGVIHGDLKPRNVRMNSQNQVKALDFGIAKAISHTRRYTMNVFASTAYCSPERLETQTMDANSDLWSVGVLLYQMMAGRLPFEEQNKERLERRIRSAIPPPPLPPSCPEPLARIILKMLSRDPAQRYLTATDVKDDLLRFRRGETVLAAIMPPPLPSVNYESDETVRTMDPGGSIPLVDVPDEDRTVRTDPRVDTAPRRAPAQPILWPPRATPSRRALGCAIAASVFCLVGLIFFLGQVRFYRDARKLASDLQTERLTNLDDAWNRYQELANRSHLGFLLWGAGNALKKRFMAAADDIILDYRNNDAPSVFEAQWTQAKDELHHALEIDPNDNAVKGRYRLCEGHIDRYSGARMKGLARQHLLNAAVAKFDEAADLLKKSPDPYLGLARIYVYDMPDLEKAEQALNKAADYGHPMGKRETAQLADGYLHRGDRFYRESQGMTEAVDQEREYLDKAKQDYMHAQELYDRSGLFGDSPRNKLKAIQGQQKVEERLDELQLGYLLPKLKDLLPK